MKITKILLAGAFVANAAAQIPSGFPACGDDCLKGMLLKAGELGCPIKDGQPDAKCLCNNQDFSYGIRDCALESCGNDTVAQGVIQFGLDYCASNGNPVALPGGSSTSSTGTGGPTSLPVPSPTGTGASVTTIVTDGSSIVSTITSATGALSSSVSSIAGGAGSSVSSVVSSVTAVVSSVTSVLTSNGTPTTVTTAVSSTVGAASSSASGPAASSTTGGNGAGSFPTAAPAGLLAVAGVAAFLL